MAALAAACRPAAAPTTCGRTDVLVRGACVDEAVAAAYCGAAAQWDRAAGACVVRPCDDGHVRDRIGGACLGARALRALGEKEHVVVDAGSVLGCSAGLELRVAGDSAHCVDPTLDPPRERACGRGEVWDGAACMRFVRSGRVDVAAWARATFGTSGPSSERFCARATLDTTPFALLSGATTTADASVELIAPDNDMTRLYARVTPIRAMPSGGLARLVAAVETEIDIVRAIGGTAEVAAVVQPLTCTVRAGTLPLAIPKARRKMAEEAEER
jgi:hypothetical protein